MRGFTSSGVSSADRMSASVRSSERQKKMTSLGFRVFPDALKGGAEQLAANNDIIFLGVRHPASSGTPWLRICDHTSRLLSHCWPEAGHLWFGDACIWEAPDGQGLCPNYLE